MIIITIVSPAMTPIGAGSGYQFYASIQVSLAEILHLGVAKDASEVLGLDVSGMKRPGMN
jgi:hypothetical protein